MCSSSDSQWWGNRRAVFLAVRTTRVRDDMLCHRAIRRTHPATESTTCDVARLTDSVLDMISCCRVHCPWRLKPGKRAKHSRV